MKRAIVPVAIAAALSFSHQASALEWDGFLTAGFSVHDQEDATYLDAITEDIRFENDSKFGLQVTADVSENMQVVSQILAAGSDENFDLDVEWAYLDWVLNDTVSIRGGKVKEPVFLISDYIEVGYAYPWIRPPQEVYRNNPINTINGFEGLIQMDVGGMGLTIQPYLGSNTEAVPGAPGLTFDASNFYGAAIQLASRSFTAQVSYLTTDVDVSGSTGLVDTSTGFPVPFSSDGTATLTSFGLSTDVNNFVAYAEYVTRDIEAESAVPMDSLFPDQDAWYVTIGYRMGNFLPHLTIANSEADPLAGASQSPLTPSPGVSQDSITLGVRYEINDSAAFKFEVQSVEPDLAASTSSGLFNTVPTGFAADDSAILISAAVDVIF
ncbi:MAG: hypothetical protein OQK98_05645 [Gammaproteobacteria bacterium]|nr:hypothetical protein [Gammaproteobacteria bacterium]